MFCLKCSYELIGLTEPRCPECGREFHPADPRSFREVPRGRLNARDTRHLSHFHLLVVLVAAGFFGPELNYLLAWAVLGHEPVPSIDDPKFITGIGWFHTICMFWMLFAIPAALLGVVLPPYIATRAEPKRSAAWWLFRSALPVAVITASFILARNAPWGPRVGEWFMD